MLCSHCSHSSFWTDDDGVVVCLNCARPASAPTTTSPLPSASTWHITVGFGPTHTCLQCGRTWRANQRKIKRCSGCNSPYWQKPKDREAERTRMQGAMAKVWARKLGL